jgi:hypothetical protein
MSQNQQKPCHSWGYTFSYNFGPAPSSSSSVSSSNTPAVKDQKGNTEETSSQSKSISENGSSGKRGGGGREMKVVTASEAITALVGGGTEIDNDDIAQLSLNQGADGKASSSMPPA